MRTAFDRPMRIWKIAMRIAMGASLTLCAAPIGLAQATTATASPIGDAIGLNRGANTATAVATDYTAYPVLNASSVAPLVMLVISRDEQLFIKAYTDYTDLDGDGLIDSTYNNGFAYSGYFDSGLCYAYAGNQFKASKQAANHQCGTSDAPWSGNFLNWVSMSRMDVLRYVLYGGYRSVDNTTTTVLRRAAIPNDLHAWAKVYTGADVGSYTPWSQDPTKPGITFCNATMSSGGNPVIRTARGNWSEWASTATKQCDWKETIGSASSDNSYNDDASQSTDAVGQQEYIAQVQVCDPASTVRENFCQLYSNNGVNSYKPVGLLQRYGEKKQMRFGLLTGSFSAPRSGGVLRRNIGALAGNGSAPCNAADEINLTDGTFCNQGAGNEGIINTLNTITLTQWNYAGLWTDCNTYGILNRQGFGSTNLNDPGVSNNQQNCSAWGNPLSEMYAEALRYIANDSGGATGTFNKGSDLSGLPAPGWNDPYGVDPATGTVRNPYCAACSIIVLSTGLNSFDSDEIPQISALGSDAAVSGTTQVGQYEGIGGNYLVGRVVGSQGELAVGQSVNTYEDLCTAKTTNDLSLVRGICPDIPSMEGSYLIAGLAYKARTTDLRPSLKTPNGEDRPQTCDANGQNCQPYKNTVQTYTVALAENLPKFQIPIGSGAISLAPLCQANNSGSAQISTSGWRSCYLGAVGIGPKISTVDSRYIYGRQLAADGSAGSFSLVWEDSLWGNDHDNDVVTMLTYCVGAACQTSSNLPSSAQQKLCFYTDTGFGGAEFCPSSAKGNFSGSFSKAVSSVHVPSGYTVKLYANTNQQGTALSLTGDDDSLVNNSRGSGNSWNDAAVSYSITGGPVPVAAGNYAGYDICWNSTSPVCGTDGKPSVGANESLVRLETLSAYAGNAMLEGYSISGSNSDGVQRLLLRPGNDNSSVLSTSVTPPASWYTPQVTKYTLGASTAQQLDNPLLYAAKYGGFESVTDDSGQVTDHPCDSTTTPACTTSNWDQVDNNTGQPEANGKGDGLPDNYFPVRNPAQLGDRLAAVFNKILSRSGSGTSAAVVSSSAAGDGMTFQALYQSQVQNKSGSQVASWAGSLNALWTDADGHLREGGYNPGGIPTLGDFTQNPIVFFCTTTQGDSRFQTFTDPTDVPAAIDPSACSGQTLDTLQTIWSAQDLLSDPSYQTLTQRTYNSAATAANGRYIFTWIDANHDGKVDPNEQVDLTWGTSGFNGTGTCDADSTVTGNYRFLNTCSAAGAESLVEWVRGTDFLGSDGKPDINWRSRTVDDKVYRLGDIVNSTPLSVAAPAEAFDLLYNDSSYGNFRQIYQNRRQMIYAGANDGMIHAFNSGFYDSADKQLRTQPIVCASSGCSVDGSYTAHPLGAEIWAYVPGNLLPHLRWMSSPDYAHMFYVDGSPIAQDARIFSQDSGCKANGITQCHPGGWGTVLIVPFRFGGGPIGLDTKSGSGGTTWQNSFPAYAVLDVTNPEAPPTVLAELTNAQAADATCNGKLVSCSDLSKIIVTYTSSLPAVAMFRPSGGTDPNPSKFFLFTAGGTTDNGGVGAVEGGSAASNAGLSIRAYDMSNLAEQDPTPVVWGNGSSVEDLTNLGTTGAGSDSFAGDLIASDYDLDGVAESLYFGSVKGLANPFGGSLWAIDFNKSTDPKNWLPRQVLTDLNRPVTIRPTLGINDQQQHMAFFGTGRAFTKSDMSDQQPQVIAAVIDQGGTVDFDGLIDVTNITVSSNGNVGGLSGVTDENALEQAVAGYPGWVYELGIKDANGKAIPAERVVSTQALSGGALLTTSYLPGTDSCTDQGEGRLYGMNYSTGTTSTGLLGFLGSNPSSQVINSSISLGSGLPSQPSLHKGSGTGKDQQLRACVQTSSGAIICHDITPLKGVASGEISWREPIDK